MQADITSLSAYKHQSSDNDVIVTFEALLSPELAFPDSQVVIAFGPPLSDWKALMVQMAIKPGTPVIEPGGYRYLTGQLPLCQKFQNKSIPYKYIVMKKGGKLIWENIKFSFEQGTLNRCLMVSDKSGNAFTKFDDVILPEEDFIKTKKSVYQLQRLGRETAMKWMVPRPSDLDDPNFDFKLALKRFHGVVGAFQDNGSRLCVGDEPKHKFNPIGFEIKSCIREYFQNFLSRLGEYLTAGDDGKTFRTAVYLTMLHDTKHITISDSKSFQLIFQAFRSAKNVLLVTDWQPKSITGEVQLKIVAAMKKLVLDFVGRRSEDVDVSGNWIYVVPFVDFWDLTEDSNWLNLGPWKESLRSR